MIEVMMVEGVPSDRYAEATGWAVNDEQQLIVYKQSSTLGQESTRIPLGQYSSNGWLKVRKV